MKCIFAVIETIENLASPSSFELISCTEKFSEGTSSKIYLVIAGKSVRDTAAQAARFGHDILVIEHDSFRYPNPDLLGRAISGLIERYDPQIIWFPHTMRSCHTAAIISANHGYSCITGIDSFRTRDTVSLFKKPICNGKVNIELTPAGEKAVVTVLTGSFPVPAIEKERQPGLVEYQEIASISNSVMPLGIRDSSVDAIRIEESDIIVSAGQGIGGRENLEMIRAVANLFDNAAVGASRPICDLKWLPYAHQVGTTGRTVSPRLYIACGISGSPQHVAGMKGSQMIIAVNTDPQASINLIADYIIIEDLRAFLPVFINKIKEQRKKR